MLYLLQDKIGRLINKLESTDDNTRMKAIEGLGKIGERSAVKALVNLLLDENCFIREEAIKSLDKIGDVSAADALIETLLRDDDRVVRKHAAWALMKIAEDRVLEPLLASIKLHDYTIYEIFWNEIPTMLILIAAKQKSAVRAIVRIVMEDQDNMADKILELYFWLLIWIFMIDPIRLIPLEPLLVAILMGEENEGRSLKYTAKSLLTSIQDLKASRGIY